jgi:hypothetical protein
LSSSPMTSRPHVEIYDTSDGIPRSSQYMHHIVDCRATKCEHYALSGKTCTHGRASAKPPNERDEGARQTVCDRLGGHRS